MFSKSGLPQYIGQLQQQAVGRVQSLTEAELASADDDERIAKGIVDKSGLSPLVIHGDQATRSGPEEAMIPSPLTMSGQTRGFRVTWRIPFGGPASLFDFTPPTFMGATPRGDVRRDHLVFVWEGGAQDGAEAQSALLRFITSLQWWVNQINGQIEHGRSELEKSLLRALAERRNVIEQKRRLREDLNR